MYTFCTVIGHNNAEKLSQCQKPEAVNNSCSVQTNPPRKLFYTPQVTIKTSLENVKCLSKCRVQIKAQGLET